MNTTRRTLIIAAIGLAAALAGCAGSDPPAATPTPTTATTTTGSSSAATSASAWSPEAVTACRQFVNGVGASSLRMAQSSNQKWQPGMTADQLSLASTGWGLTVAMMHVPANIGMDAEPEVHDALAGAVAVAATLLPVTHAPGSATVIDNHDAYVKGMSYAFGKAIDVCTRVGVITP